LAGRQAGVVGFGQFNEPVGDRVDAAEVEQVLAVDHGLGECCATLILRMSATLILGMSWLWKTPPGRVRRGWVVLGLSRVVLRVSR